MQRSTDEKEDLEGMGWYASHHQPWGEHKGSEHEAGRTGMGDQHTSEYRRPQESQTGAEKNTAGDRADQLDSHMSPASLKLIPSGVKDKSHQNRSLEFRVSRYSYFS